MTEMTLNYCGVRGNLTVQLLELTPNRARIEFPDGSTGRWSCDALLEHNPKQALDLLRLMAQNNPDQFGPGCNNPYHEKLRYLEILAAPSFSGCTQYLSDFPAGPHRLEVVQSLTSAKVFQTRSCQEVVDLLLDTHLPDVRRALLTGLEPRVWKKVRYPVGSKQRDWQLVYQEFFIEDQHRLQLYALSNKLYCYSHPNNLLLYTDKVCSTCGWRICRIRGCCCCNDYKDRWSRAPGF